MNNKKLRRWVPILSVVATLILVYLSVFGELGEFHIAWAFIPILFPFAIVAVVVFFKIWRQLFDDYDKFQDRRKDKRG